MQVQVSEGLTMQINKDSIIKTDTIQPAGLYTEAPLMM